jgi:hypothetical protein
LFDGDAPSGFLIGVLPPVHGGDYSKLCLDQAIVNLLSEPLAGGGSLFSGEEDATGVPSV